MFEFCRRIVPVYNTRLWLGQIPLQNSFYARGNLTESFQVVNITTKCQYNDITQRISTKPLLQGLFAPPLNSAFPSPPSLKQTSSPPQPTRRRLQSCNVLERILDCELKIVRTKKMLGN